MKTDYATTPDSKNSKTGNMPTLWVGVTKEQALESCRISGCKLLPRRFGGADGWINDELKLKPCYAWQGTVKMAARSIYRSFARNDRKYGIEHALNAAPRSARVLRLTGIGDPSALTEGQADHITEVTHYHKMKLYGFTAGWRFASWWKGRLMASTFTLEEADEALDKGWRASTVLPHDFVGEGPKKNTFVTPKGRKGVVCPFQMGARLQCTTCKLCVAEKRGPIIGFVSHR
jgi:hypothetical protein